ncbi:MAG TPA: hypothetical protein VEX67_14765 [Solirubrobacteraceae bacterium]|nr:hypothetical protein [Solirubrobacteraceae bacterium]
MRTTELTLVTGEHYVVSGDREQVEKTILAAARGSLMQFAWFEVADDARPLGVVPGHVVSLRAADSG